MSTAKEQEFITIAAPLSSGRKTFRVKKAMDLDPELQRNIALLQNGQHKLATASTAADEAAVIAVVTDDKQWMKLTEIRTPLLIGATADDQYIVTGRIALDRLEFIKNQPWVQSLKAARKLSPTLSATLTEIEVATEHPLGMLNPGGKGCIVGIIDFDCDFAHKNFLKGNRTRLLKIWDQRSHTGSTKVPYGTVYEAADIDKALASDTPYNALGYHPKMASHGTHVMDIAAGNGGGSNVHGVAPEADIIFVHIDDSTIPLSGLGDSMQMLEAMRFIFDEAGDRPCVINVSLATNGGPHDGTSPVEKGIDVMLREKPGRAVVIAAANSFTHQINAHGQIEVGGMTTLGWELKGNQQTENAMEIWYDGAGRIIVELVDASGNVIGEVEPGEVGEDSDDNGIITSHITNRLNEPNNHDNQILIHVKGMDTWTVRLKNSGDVPVSFHAWIERNDGAQARFNTVYENQITLGAISCGHESIVVGSYDAHREEKPLSYFSSSGPTRDNREKPEIAAPGHDVKAACSLTVNGVISKSGTSMAAPAVTGAIAVYLAEAFARGIKPPIDQIRDVVIKSACISPPEKTWDNRYGWGRISVKKMVDSLADAEAKPTASNATWHAPNTALSKPVKKNFKEEEAAKPHESNIKKAKKDEKKCGPKDI
jgi:subtilisin family serine protease